LTEDVRNFLRNSADPIRWDLVPRKRLSNPFAVDLLQGGRIENLTAIEAAPDPYQAAAYLRSFFARFYFPAPYVSLLAEEPRILTFDRDFTVYRWARNRKFDLH